MLKKIKNKKGMTLIELLIASLLGFIVTSTAIDLIFSSTSSSYKELDTIKLQQDGLFTTILLSNDILRSGDLDYGESVFERDPFNWSMTGASDSTNDELAIQFFNHDNQPNCSGDQSLGVLINHYEVKNGTLTCNDVNIIENVERFNIYFGVDLTGDGVVNRYVDRDTAFSVNNEKSKRVLALKFNILLSTNKGYGQTNEKSFTLVNGENVTYNDDKEYKYFERNILLRNML